MVTVPHSRSNPKSPPLPSGEPPFRPQRPSDRPPSLPTHDPQNGETTSLAQARHDLPRLLHHPRPRHLPCVSKKYPPPTRKHVAPPPLLCTFPFHPPLDALHNPPPPQNKSPPTSSPKSKNKTKNKTLSRFSPNHSRRHNTLLPRLGKAGLRHNPARMVHRAVPRPLLRGAAGLFHAVSGHGGRLSRAA